MIEKFLIYLRNCGWKIEMIENRGHNLPETVKSRYKKIPEKWFEFIDMVKSIVSSDETIWFLCEEDYIIEGDNAYQWNEWELISLESAEDDVKWKNKIEEFWNNYFPIIMSVKDGYSYYAISMKDGSIVCGNEPEFEEYEVVADSFTDFMGKIIDCKIRL